jgi:RNA polymerase sigma factor (sigma-70 family)
MYLDAEIGPRTGAQGLVPIDAALDGFELVYSFIYARVGNRPDAEDLTQQVALKALPRLREGASAAEVRGYLFATARSVISAFWAGRYRLPELALADNIADAGRGDAPEASASAQAWLEQTLAALPAHYRQVLELRFLRELSLREVAREMDRSVGAVKLLQLRALRAAAATMPDDPRPKSASRSRRSRRRREVAPGFAYAPQPAARAF